MADQDTPDHGPTRYFLQEQLKQALEDQERDQDILNDAKTDAEDSDRRVAMITLALEELDHLEATAAAAAIQDGKWQRS